MLICGAGVIGLTTAHYLRKLGHDVTILEKQSSPARVASLKNGAFLDPALYTSWADYALIKRGIRSTFNLEEGSGGAAKVRFNAFKDIRLYGWGFRFLFQSLPMNSDLNSRHIRDLAFYSMKKLGELQQTHHLDMTRTAKGSLEVFATEADFQHAIKSDRKKHVDSLRIPLHVLDPEESMQMEPAVVPNVYQYGSLFSELGSNGDVHQFSNALEEIIVNEGVKIKYNTEICTITTKNDCVVSMTATNGQVFTADSYVLALGVHTAALAQKAGVMLSMIPVKGYIISAPVAEGFKMLERNVYAGGNALIAPLGTMLRISGGADLSGLDYSEEPDRAQWVLDQAKKLFPPGYIDESRATFHSCIRPVSADDVPFIGQTKVSNLYVNAAHGSKGWTQCFGAGALLADQISGRTPELDLTPFSPNRFSCRFT